MPPSVRQTAQDIGTTMNTLSDFLFRQYMLSANGMASRIENNALEFVGFFGAPKNDSH